MATTIDRYTREVVGVHISRFHNWFLAMGAFLAVVNSHHVQISMSSKGSPWQNGHEESFFGKFKTEAGYLNRFETLGELIEYLYQRIYYYNNERIHTALKMTPAAFRLQSKQRFNQHTV